MEYSIRPSRQELEKIRSKIENTVDSYSYALELERPEIIVSWQRFEQDFTVISVDENRVNVAVNIEASEIEVDEILLRGLLEAEFNLKSSYDISLKWQELAKFAYVAKRFNEITGEELIKAEEVVEKWPEIRKQLGDNINDYDEFFYLNTGMIGEALAIEFENYEADELVKMSKSDFEKIGDEL